MKSLISGLILMLVLACSSAPRLVYLPGAQAQIQAQNESRSGAKAIVLDTQNKANTTIPWHPGAEKYFKEAGAKM